MLQKILQAILRRYFGDFLTEFQNIQLALWSGHINVQKTSLKHQKINQLLQLKNIPLSIRYSYIGSLQAQIPWKNLSSSPVEVKLSDVYIICTLNAFTQNNSSQDPKINLIQSYVEHLLKKSDQGKQEGKTPYFQKLLIKILHNLNLKINNISIRIQSGQYYQQQGLQSFYSCQSEEEQQQYSPIQSFNGNSSIIKGQKPFALGFCIESLQSFTIDQNNERKYINIDSNLTAIRKNVQIKQISVYWEDFNTLNLLGLDEKIKHNIMVSFIKRKQERLLTIDGNLLLEKNCRQFDYWLSSNFNLVEVSATNQQLKQMIKVYQKFEDMRIKSKLMKLEELPQGQQIMLQKTYKQNFGIMFENNFKDISHDQRNIIKRISKKRLLQWSKEEMIQILKKKRVINLQKQRNKKGWLSFLKSNIQIKVSEEDVETIQKQVIQLVEAQQIKHNIKYGFNIQFEIIKIQISQKKTSQQIFLICKKLSFAYQKDNEIKRIITNINDFEIQYALNKENIKIGCKILQKRSQQQFLILRNEITKNQFKIMIQLASFNINHQIKVLAFVRELIKLKQNQQLNSNFNIIKSQNSPKQVSNLNEKKYDINIDIKAISFIIEVDKQSFIVVSMQKLQIKRLNHSQHDGIISSFKIDYQKIVSQNIINESILSDLNISLHLNQGFKHLQCEIDEIILTLSQQDFIKIHGCFKGQLNILKLKKRQQNKQLILESTYHTGYLKLLNLFKTWMTYYCILTDDSILFYEDKQFQNLKPSLYLPLNNAHITKMADNQFKLQSSNYNQILECESASQQSKWIQKIQSRIFQCSSKNNLYSLIDQTKLKTLTNIYSTQMNFSIKQVSIHYNLKHKHPIMKFYFHNLQFTLKQDNFVYQRIININKIELISCIHPQNFPYARLVNNFNEDKNYPIKIFIQGKKKLHPQYIGQIQIGIEVEQLTINYNAEAIYSIMRKLHKENIFPYGKQAKDRKILQMVQQIINSQKFKDKEDKREKVIDLEESKCYTEIDKFKKKYSCLVLLEVKVAVQKININLINGRTFQCVSSLRVQDLTLNIDKGSSFMFVKVIAGDLELFDTSGYPKTTLNNQKLAIIKTQKHRKHRKVAEVYCSNFQPQIFENKSKIKTFINLNFYDLQITYQHQPAMRFIDFMNNQIISFILQPYSLRKYDQIQRGQFAYGEEVFTKNQAKKLIGQFLQPYFNQISINASNLLCYFNSFPELQTIPVTIQSVTIKSEVVLKPQRIILNSAELQRYQKWEIYNQLLKNKYFMDRILKNQWASKLYITAKNCHIQFIQNEFDYSLVLERVLMWEKQLLFTVIKVNRDLLIESYINNLQVIANKDVYNLINKCIMHNVGWDDGADKLFVHNYEHKDKFKPSQLFYGVMIKQFSVRIPEINQCLIIIQDCTYIFRRLPNMFKQMIVSGKFLNIFQGRHIQIITPKKVQQLQKALQYSLEINTNGDKIMNAYVHDINIDVDMDIFKKLGSYFLLDQACYPPSPPSQLPLITCKLYLVNSQITLIKVNNLAYNLQGDVNFVWVRNRRPHPQSVLLQPQKYANGIEDSSYRITLKDLSFRQVSLLSNRKANERNYRLLSNPINLTIKIVNVSKLSPTNQQYNDTVNDYQIDSLHLRLSYLDIIYLKNHFSSKQTKQQPQLPPSPSIIKHQLNIEKMSFKAGVSQLAVPLINVCLDETKLKIQQYTSIVTINMDLHLGLNYWNMLIGRWQPIIEKLSSILSLKLGSQKYILIDSSEQILIDLSTQSLKVILLLIKDIQAQGKLQVINKKENQSIGINLSPYAITNMAGVPIIIESDFIKPIKIYPEEKIHLETNSEDITEGLSKIISFQIEGSSQFYEIDLNMTEPTRIEVIFGLDKQQVCIRPISSSIMKEVILSGCYAIFNKTSFNIQVSVASQTVEIKALEKKALRVGSKILGKQLKLQFNHLNEIEDNYQFEYNDTISGYQHYILYSNKKFFHCMVTLREDVDRCLVVEPVYYLKNLLPVDMIIEFLVKRGDQKATYQQVLEVSQQKQFYDMGLYQDVDIRIKIKGFNISSFQKFSSTNDYSFQINSIQLVDHRADYGSIKVSIIKQGKVKKVYFYADAILINQTPYELYAFVKGKLLPGQKIKGIQQSDTKFVFVNDYKLINLGFDENNSFNSEQFSVTELGNQSLIMYQGLQQYQMTVNNTLHCLDNQSKIYCNLMKVSPAFVFVNSTSKYIVLSQLNLELKRVHLSPNQRVSWHWFHKNQPKQIIVKLINNQIDIPIQPNLISQPFDLHTLQETVIVLRPNSNSNHRQLIKVQSIKQFTRTFITLKQVKIDTEDQIFIVNQLRYSKLKVYQSIVDNRNPPWSSKKYFESGTNQKISFGWDYPNDSHLVTVEIYFTGHRRSKFYQQIIEVDLDMPQQVVHRISKDDNEELDIKILVESVGSRKTLKICERDEMGEDEELKMEMSGSRLGISLSDVGISIISGRKPRKEIVYLNVQKIEIMMMEKKQIRSFQLKVKYINADNNTKHSTIYPFSSPHSSIKKL